jgi:hypothetical protein
MNITVARLEQYPNDQPTGWAVGFNVVANNDRSFYVDTVVSFDDAESDEDAVDNALSTLSEGINSRVDALEGVSSLLGTDVTDKL